MTMTEQEADTFAYETLRDAGFLPETPFEHIAMEYVTVPDDIRSAWLRLNGGKDD